MDERRWIRNAVIDSTRKSNGDRVNKPVHMGAVYYRAPSGLVIAGAVLLGIAVWELFKWALS